MSKNDLTSVGLLLEQSLTTIRAYDQYYDAGVAEQTIHVPSIGSGVSVAYEQLRNASENIEDSLLLQGAITRFYRRNVSFAVKREPKDIGRELIMELTQAEYIENDTYTASTAKRLDEIITSLYALYWKLTTSKKRISREMAQRWVLELLAVQTDQVFHNPARVLSFANIAYTYFDEQLQIEDYIVADETFAPEDYQKLLYIAVHKALLRSNNANIRNALIDAYGISITRTAEFAAFNSTYDALADSKTVAQLSHVVNRNGAPLRAIRSTFLHKCDDGPIELHSPQKTLLAVEKQLDDDYSQAKKSASRGIVKSVIFLILTKAIVGLVVEIPYDLLTVGYVAMLPLAVNFLLPPLVIALMALTIKQPSEANKRLVVDHVENILYKHATKDLPLATATPTASSMFNGLYAVLSLGIFALISWGLALIGFNIVQGVIFFIFISTALFLGYRLTLQIRELELIANHRGGLELVRDFIQTPFIFLGKRISYRFSTINITAQIFDTIIELPLKTVLRLVRQWSAFLDNKKDELL